MVRLDEGVLIVGKQNDPILQLTPDEKLAIINSCSTAQCDGNPKFQTVHKRLLIHRVLFSSSSYTRQLSTCDYVMKFSDEQIGFVMKYFSTSLTSCSTSSSPCTHLVLAHVFPVRPQNLISDDLSGALVAHIHHFNDSR